MGAAEVQYRLDYLWADEFPMIIFPRGTHDQVHEILRDFDALPEVSNLTLTRCTPEDLHIPPNSIVRIV